MSKCETCIYYTENHNCVKFIMDPRDDWIKHCTLYTQKDLYEQTQGDGKFECSIKIKDLISMLLEFDMNRKADIYTNDENNIVISITDMQKGEEE